MFAPEPRALARDLQRAALAWSLLTLGCALIHLHLLTRDATAFASLWDYAGWALLFTAPWAFIAAALGLSEALARALSRGRGSLLAATGALLIPGAGLLDGKLRALGQGAIMDPGLGSLGFARQAWQHPVEALLLSGAACLGWSALGGLRLRAQSLGLELAAAAVTGAGLGVLLWALRLDHATPRLVGAVAFPLAWVATLRLVEWRLPPQRQPHATANRWTARWALVLTLAVSSSAAVMQTEIAQGAWQGYLLRTRSGDSQRDLSTRRRALGELVRLGEPGFRAMLRALAPGVGQRPYAEAAKALGDLGDSRAIPHLLNGLEREAVGWRRAYVEWGAPKVIRLGQSTGCSTYGVACGLEGQSHVCARPRADEAAEVALCKLGVRPNDYPALIEAVARPRYFYWDYGRALGPASVAELLALHDRIARVQPRAASHACHAIRTIAPREEALVLLADLALTVSFEQERNQNADWHLGKLWGSPRQQGRWARAGLVADLARSVECLRPLLWTALDDPRLDERVAAEALLLAGEPVDQRLLVALGSHRAGLAPARLVHTDLSCCMWREPPEGSWARPACPH